MVKIIVGCAGWDYKDWVGPFYPKHLPEEKWLAYYTKFFEFTEINSTFYNLPTQVTVLKWANSVPDNFRFTVKVWQNITHRRANHQDLITLFLDRMSALKPKLIGYLLQFPPKFKYTADHYEEVTQILQPLSAETPVFIEFRHPTWFDPSLLNQFVDGNQAVLVTNYKDNIQPIYLENQSRYYIRLIGDRELTSFNRIQRNQDQILEEVKRKLSSWERQPGIKEVIVNFNNHFRGFSPQDVNEFKQATALPYHDFKKQHTLMDFMK